MEILIASALLLVVLALLAVSVRAVGRLWVRTEKKAAAQSNALLAVSRLREELRGADPDSLAPGSGQLCFVSCLDRQGRVRFEPKTAATLWQKRVAFYRVGTELRVQESYDVDLDPTTPPGPLARVPEVERVDWLDVGRPARVVARGIVAFEAGRKDGGLLSLRVEAEKDGLRSRLETAILPLMPARSGQVSQRGR